MLKHGALAAFAASTALVILAVASPPFLRHAHAEEGGWTQLPPMSFPRQGHSATLLADGRLLVAGGLTTGDIYGVTLSSAEIYDPGTNAWSPAGSMTYPRIHHAAVRLADGRVLVVGGGIFAGDMTAEIYDPIAATWSLTANSAADYQGANADLLPDGRVLISAGVRSSYSEVYNVFTNAWTSISYPAGIGGQGARSAQLADGRVVLSWYETAIFDPGTDVWSLNDSPTAPSHVLVTLLDGRILSSGGYDFYNEPVTNVETFDPATGVWTAATPSLHAHSGHTATRTRAHERWLPVSRRSRTVRPADVHLDRRTIASDSSPMAHGYAAVRR